MTWPTNTNYKLKINFRSTDLINIRITYNDFIDVIQCRTTMTKVVPIVFDEKASIKIENLSPNAPCIIDSVIVNYLDITNLMFNYTETFEKETMNKIGDFVTDIYSPDVSVIKFNLSLDWYGKILPKFKDGTINWVS